MTKRSLLSIRALGICGLSAASLALSVALLVACATDNGDALHGPQFGPPPDRPDGSAEGSVTAADGSLAADAGAEGAPSPMPRLRPPVRAAVPSRSWRGPTAP